MDASEKICEFLGKAKVFYLSTVDGDKPKCRPLGLYLPDGGRVHFGVGTFKDVYKQMQANPNVEICAFAEGGWLRFYGRAVFEEGYELAEKALDLMPSLRGIYNEESGLRLGVFHLEQATAEFRSMMEVEESYSVD